MVQVAPPQFAGQLGGARPQTKGFAAATAEVTGQSKNSIKVGEGAPDAAYGATRPTRHRPTPSRPMTVAPPVAPDESAPLLEWPTHRDSTGEAAQRLREAVHYLPEVAATTRPIAGRYIHHEYTLPALPVTKLLQSATSQVQGCPSFSGHPNASPKLG